jgi:plasmid stabilization system protein ParE
MIPLLFSPRAQADIEQIWDYSAERFGAEQADDAIREIQRAAQTIAGDPRRGREQQGDAQNAHRSPRRRTGSRRRGERKSLGAGLFSIGTGRRQNPASQRLSVT